MTLIASVWSVLGDPWSEPLNRRAFAEVALLGVAGGLLGCWVVFYGLAYSAESLAHALLPGLVIAALAGFPVLLGGGLGLLLAALAVAVVGRTPEIGRDTAVAVVVTALLGLGALLALSPETPPGLQAVLFGDILGLTDADLLLALGLAAAVALALAVLHPGLALVAFDRAGARSLGRRPLVFDLALAAMLALTILVAVQALGNLLVVAVLIAPAACARRLTRRLAPMFAVSAGVAVAAGIAGLYLSYHLEIAAGASIAGALVGAFAIAEATAALRARAGPSSPTGPRAAS